MVESKAVWTGKRRPYKNQGDATKAKEVRAILEDGEEEDVSEEIPDEFFVVSNRGFLPIEMAEIYNLLQWHTPPASFRRQIDKDDALGNVSKLRAKNIS